MTNGVRARLPELLLAALGGSATVAATLAVHASDRQLVRDRPMLDAAASWPTEIAVATDLVAPSIVAAAALLLLLRAGHRRLAATGAAGWFMAQVLAALLTPDLWIFLLDLGPDSDGGPTLRGVLSVAVGTLLVTVVPVLAARRLVPASTSRPSGGRLAAAHAALTALGVLGWSIAREDSTLLDDQRWLLLVLAVAVTSALVAGVSAGRRPDGVTLTCLLGALGAWRLVVLGLGGVDGMWSWVDDAVRVLAVGVAALLTLVLGRILPGAQTLTRRGPVLWGREPAAPAPTDALDVRIDGPRARPSARMITIAVSLTLASTAAVGWEAHQRSGAVTRDTLASARDAATSLDPAALADGRADVVGTACGNGNWTWCATTTADPRAAAATVADGLASRGWDLGEVRCSDADDDAPTSAMPVSFARWAPTCSARATRGDVVLAVVAGDTLRSPFAGREGGQYPPVRQVRTAVSVGAGASHDDPQTENLASVGAARRPLLASVADPLTPSGWTASTSCSGTEGPVPATGCPGGISLTVRMHPVGVTSPDALMAALRQRLLAGGYLVSAVGCVGPDDCRVLAERWLSPRLREHELVLGRLTADGDVLLSVG